MAAFLETAARSTQREIGDYFFFRRYSCARYTRIDSHSLIINSVLRPSVNMIAVMLQIVKLGIVVQSAAWLCLSYDGAERKDGKQRSVPMGCKC